MYRVVLADPWSYTPSYHSKARLVLRSRTSTLDGVLDTSNASQENTNIFCGLLSHRMMAKIHGLLYAESNGCPSQRTMTDVSFFNTIRREGRITPPRSETVARPPSSLGLLRLPGYSL